MKYLIGLLVAFGLVYGGMTYFKPVVVLQPAVPAAAGQVIKVTGQNFRFNPDKIQVKKGDKVRIALTAVDMPHDFDLDELGVNGPVVQPGETTEVEFIADKTGEFEYYCSVGKHRANGMVGKLIVTE